MSPPGPHAKARFVRLSETGRPALAFTIDGEAANALQGDTLLVAVLQQRGALRQSEFGDGPRAGFCLMGACQDCWMWTAEGDRVRACSTPVAAGMAVYSQQPRDDWSRVAAFSARLQSQDEGETR